MATLGQEQELLEAIKECDAWSEPRFDPGESASSSHVVIVAFENKASAQRFVAALQAVNNS